MVRAAVLPARGESLRATAATTIVGTGGKEQPVTCSAPAHFSSPASGAASTAAPTR